MRFCFVGKISNGREEMAILLLTFESTNHHNMLAIFRVRIGDGTETLDHPRVRLLSRIGKKES